METQTVQLLGQIATICVVAVLGAMNHFKGRKVDRDRRHQLTQQFASMRDSSASEFSELRASIKEVRDICVGHDGENGLRGDLREVKARVIGLEERERFAAGIGSRRKRS